MAVVVRVIQNGLLKYYEEDFSKHAPKEIIPRIQMVWNSIPAQLAKENRKFIYGIRAFCNKYQPEIAIRSSMSNYRKEEWMINVPLFMLSQYIEGIE